MKKQFTSILFVLALFTITSCQPPAPKVSHYRSADTEKLNLPFSDAVQVGNMLYLSGQVGNLPGELKLAEGGIEAETRQVMENIKRVLEANGSSFDHVIKMTVFIDDIAQWGDFNEVYVQYFHKELPARSALGAEGLALGAAVEVECIAYIPN